MHRFLKWPLIVTVVLLVTIATYYTSYNYNSSCSSSSGEPEFRTLRSEVYCNIPFFDQFSGAEPANIKIYDKQVTKQSLSLSLSLSQLLLLLLLSLL